jgi:hypothetical protein
MEALHRALHDARGHYLGSIEIDRKLSRGAKTRDTLARIAARSAPESAKNLPTVQRGNSPKEVR